MTEERRQLTALQKLLVFVLNSDNLTLPFT